MQENYTPRHANDNAPRVQPFAGDNKRNLNPNQFGSGARASGKVKTGFNPFGERGMHRMFRM